MKRKTKKQMMKTVKTSKEAALLFLAYAVLFLAYVAYGVLTTFWVVILVLVALIGRMEIRVKR